MKLHELNCRRRVPPRKPSESAEATVPARARPPARATRARRPVPAAACAPALKAARCLCRGVSRREASTTFLPRPSWLSTLARSNKFEDGAVVDAQALIDAGIVKKTLRRR